MLRNIIFGLISGMLLFGAYATVQAAPFTLDDKIELHELKFAPMQKHKEVLWAGAKGKLGDKPHFIAINGMTPYRQEKVIIASLNDKNLSLDIVKDTWNEVLKNCQASANSNCNIDFRNFGDAGFKISGAPGAEYQLIVLAGPEHAVDETLETPIYSVSKDKINSMSSVNSSQLISENSSFSGFQIVVIALLVVLVVVVSIVSLKLLKNKSSVNNLFVLLFLPALLLLHQQDLSAAKSTTPVSYYKGMAQAEMNRIEDDAFYNGLERDTNSSIGKSVSGMASQVGKGVKILTDARALNDVWLSNCSVLHTGENAPRIPSFCAGDEGCQTCYREANTDFNKARATLEKLRLIYSCSQNFSKKAIAFGDSASGIHAVVGLAWQQQKMDILKSVKNLKGAYDNKYPELMNRLKASMIKQNQCEAKFGVPDWYDRFGHMYYEFMAEKYKRSN